MKLHAILKAIIGTLILCAIFFNSMVMKVIGILLTVLLCWSAGEENAY